MAARNDYAYLVKRKGKPLEDFDDSSDCDQEDLREILDSRNPPSYVNVQENFKKQKTNDNINSLPKNTATIQKNTISDNAFNDDNNNYFLHFVNFVNNIDLQYNSRFTKFKPETNSNSGGSGQNSGDNNANIYTSCSKIDSNYSNSRSITKKRENINHFVKNCSIANINNNASLIASCSKVDFNDYVSRNDSYPTTKKCEKAVKNIEHSINGDNNASMLASCSKVDSNYSISRKDSYETTKKYEKAVKNIEHSVNGDPIINGDNNTNMFPSCSKIDSKNSISRNDSYATDKKCENAVKIEHSINSGFIKNGYNNTSMFASCSKVSISRNDSNNNSEISYENTNHNAITNSNLDESNNNSYQIPEKNVESDSDRYKRYYKRMRRILKYLIYEREGYINQLKELEKQINQILSVNSILLHKLIYYMKNETVFHNEGNKQVARKRSMDEIWDYLKKEIPVTAGVVLGKFPLSKNIDILNEDILSSDDEELPTKHQPNVHQNSCKRPENQAHSSLNPNHTTVQKNLRNSLPLNKKCISNDIYPSSSNGKGKFQAKNGEHSLLKKVLLSKEISTPYKPKKPEETQIREAKPDEKNHGSKIAIPTIIIPYREYGEVSKYIDVIQGQSSTSLGINLRSTGEELADWSLTIPKHIFSDSEDQGTFGPASIVPEENIEFMPTCTGKNNSLDSCGTNTDNKIEISERKRSRIQTVCKNSQPVSKRRKLTEKDCMEARIVDIPGRIRTIPPVKKEEKKTIPNKYVASTSGVKLLPPPKGKPLPSLFNVPQPSFGVRVLLPKPSTVEGPVSTGKPMPSDLKKQLSAKEANRKKASKRRVVRRRKPKRSPNKEEKQSQNGSASSVNAVDFESLLDDQIMSQFFEHSPLITEEVEKHFEMKYLDNMKKENLNLKKLPEKTFDEPELEPEITPDNILGNEIKLDDLLTPELEEKLLTEDGILEVLSNEEVNLDLEDIISDELLNNADVQIVN